MNEDKPKGIIERYFTSEGRFRMGEFLGDYEVTIMNYQNRINNLETRVMALEEAIAFFSKWWDETQNPDNKKVNLLVPEHLQNYKK